MGKEVKVRGVPVFVSSRRLPPRTPEIVLKATPIRPLTEKQKKAKAAYIALGATPDVKAQAGLIAGYSDESHAIRGVNSAIRPIVGKLEDKGVDDDMIVDTIKDGLVAMNAFKPEQKDHHARHKFVQEVNKLTDNYPPKRIQSEERKYVLTLTGQDIRQVREADRIREEHDRDPI